MRDEADLPEAEEVMSCFNNRKLLWDGSATMLVMASWVSDWDDDWFVSVRLDGGYSIGFEFGDLFWSQLLVYGMPWLEAIY